MKNVRRDVLVLAGDVVAGPLVEHDERRRVRGADALVGVVHARRGVEVKVIAVNQNRTVRGVVRPDTRAGNQVEAPQNVRVQRAGFEQLAIGRRTQQFGSRFRADFVAGFGADRVGRGHVGGFVSERAVVAIGHAARVEAEHSAAIVHEIHPIAFHRGSGRHAHVRPIHVGILVALRDDELPEQFPSFFVQAHEHAAIALVLGIARFAVVRADVNAPPGDDRRGMSLRAEFDRPLDIPAGLGIERIRQPAFVGNHVA